MVLDSSSTYYYPEAELSESGAEVTYMLSYTYTDIDTDRIETPRISQPRQQTDNVIVVDKSNVYFSDYTPLETSRVESPRTYDFAPTGVQCC